LPVKALSFWQIKMVLYIFVAMAKKAKPAKEEKKNAGVLKQDSEPTLEVKQLLKDERTHKIAGTVFLLIAFLLFIAFTSYLFTWDEDQDEVFKAGSNLFWGTDVKVSNLLGTLGAFLSHFFIYKGCFLAEKYFLLLKM
jgi:DNA segregation ATPase FtsK/SpoIIIE, S-DNA-T family